MSCGCTDNSLCCCTFVVSPGEDIQAALDSLPVEGGCVCLKAGTHEITESLRIDISNVKLMGESPGAVVVRRNGARLLTVEPPGYGEYLYDIVVETIAFEFDNSQISQNVTESLIRLNRCEDVTIKNCRISATTLDNLTDAGPIGVSIGQGFRFRLQRCSLNRVIFGVYVYADSSDLYLFDNVFNAELETDSSAGGWIGVYAKDMFGPLFAEGNVIEGFLTGISLNRHYFDLSARPQSMAHGSILENNHIGRGPLGMDAGLDAFFAIDVPANGCRIRNNTIRYPSLGGIWVTGSHCRVEGNRLIKGTGDSFQSVNLTYGIVIGHYLDWWLSMPGFTADDLVAILGHEIPEISLSDCTVLNNDISGSSFGILVSDHSNLQILANRPVDTLFGVFTTEVDGAQISDNRISNTPLAFSAVYGSKMSATNNFLCNSDIASLLGWQSNLDFSQNHIIDASLAGIIGVQLTENVSFTENHLAQCGHLPPDNQGTRFSIFLFNLQGDLCLESNQILDTGISPAGDFAGASTISIFAAATHCTVSGNVTGFSQTDLLDANLEHRALWLIGHGLYYDIQLATGHYSFGEGAAQIIGNRFIGPGLSALVEIQQVTDPNGEIRRFDRMTYANNYVRHISTTPDPSKASVKLKCGKAIVMGNHIQATTDIQSVDFQGTPGVFSGNITQTGAFNFTDFPNPQGNYNQ